MHLAHKVEHAVDLERRISLERDKLQGGRHVRHRFTPVC